MRWTRVVVVGAILVGCNASENTLTRADFADDPIFSIEIDGVLRERFLAGPIGSRVSNDRGYQAQRIWDNVDHDAYQDLLDDLMAADVAFHRAACFESATSFSGSKTLDSGVLVSVNALQDHVNGSASVMVTGLEPNEEGASGFRPPDSIDIDEACDPELLSAAGLT